MEYAKFFEQLETNDNPFTFIVVLLIAIVLLFLIYNDGSTKKIDNSLLAKRCKNCRYLRQDYTAIYGCDKYKWLRFPWSKKKKPCPVEEYYKQLEEDKRAYLAKYETRKKEILESDGVIEGIFYIYNGQIIPDYYSECLMADNENSSRNEMYHERFHQAYMKMKFSGLVGNNHYSIPRGRIACPLDMPDEPYLSIDKCYENDADIIRQIKELYRLQNVENIDINTHGYSCPNCFSKK